MHDVFHVQHVKPCVLMPGEQIPPVPPPPPVQRIGRAHVPIWRVEALLDHRWERDRRGEPKLYLLVKWEGYSDESNTWEPREHLVTCNAEVRRYKLERGIPLERRDLQPDGDF